MSKFKIGDKVRRIDYSTSERMKIGSEWIVKWAMQGNEFIVLEDSLPRPWNECGFELVQSAPTPHPHAALIKQWADNPKLKFQFQEEGMREWQDCHGSPAWCKDTLYRIKPEPKPDTMLYATAYNKNGVCTFWEQKKNPLKNIKATFDGETGKLKAVELI